MTAKVSLGQYEDNGFGIAAEFTVELPELSSVEAAQFIGEAQNACPYSKMWRGGEALKINLRRKTNPDSIKKIET